MDIAVDVVDDKSFDYMEIPKNIIYIYNAKVWEIPTYMICIDNLFLHLLPNTIYFLIHQCKLLHSKHFYQFRSFEIKIQDYPFFKYFCL